MVTQRAFQESSLYWIYALWIPLFLELVCWQFVSLLHLQLELLFLLLSYHLVHLSAESTETTVE